MSKVEIRGVSKRFGGVTAVNDFSLEIADGEFTILVGPSGCGKTTLLRIVAGLESPSSGEIIIDGLPVTHVPPKKRDIAMVFQNYALYPHMKVYDNLAFCLKLTKMPKAEIDAKVKRAAALLGVGDLLSRLPHQLSGGQRQRVALGRAIIRNPKVFLFDEPLSNLDAKLRVSMRAELMELHHRLKTTAIYVTHDQMEAMTMGTRLVIMKDGFVQQVGSPQEIYNRPRNLFVAGFIGSPAMNFIDGRLGGSGGEVFFEAAGMKIPLPESLSARLRGRLAKPVVLGVRPEHIRKAGSECARDIVAPFDARVRLVEPLGSEQFVHLQVGESRIVARLDPLEHFGLGETVRFCLPVERGHLFDPETQQALY
jgi:multiple sugar transport system ATP-binding protein